jgi:4a-hydroxytetrahydrobiopterin dehydratase
MKTYSENSAKQKLESFKNWSFQDNAITKTFVFANFSQAFAFMLQVGILSEKLNHHPDWTNVYNKVFIRLTTHDIGGVTDKDFALAALIEAL